MYKIMIVEDDLVLQEEISIMLKSNGYDIIIIKDFENIVENIKSLNPHLILLDINLPIQDGYKICLKVRSFSNVPIIFVTSRNTDIDELNSIMIGGDDFITKPYNVAILLARIAALLKRTYNSMNIEEISYKGVILALDKSEILYNNKSIELTKNELKILHYLFKNSGKIVKRLDLIEYLWDNQLYIDDNTLSVNIRRIREKLSQIGLKDFIITKHRQGYLI